MPHNAIRMNSDNKLIIQTLRFEQKPSSAQIIDGIIIHSSRLDTYFHPKILIFFLFLYENICCGYSLKVSQ